MKWPVWWKRPLVAPPLPPLWKPCPIGAPCWPRPMWQPARRFLRAANSAMTPPAPRSSRSARRCLAWWNAPAPPWPVLIIPAPCRASPATGPMMSCSSSSRKAQEINSGLQHQALAFHARQIVCISTFNFFFEFTINFSENLAFDCWAEA